MLREFFKFRSISQFTNKGTELKKSDFYDFWNLLDIMNIIFMVPYLLTDRAEFYAVMALFTWINLLQYLRLYPYFRFFIDLLKSVFLSDQTWKFFTVMIVMLMAFSNALHLLSLKDDTEYTEDYHFMNLI
jgi:hypothetical protein